MKLRRTSASDLLAHEEWVPRFYELLASVGDEELREIFHDFMVPADDSDEATVSDQTPGSSAPTDKTPPRGRGL